MDGIITIIGFYAFPLIGSIALAWGIFQLISDLRRTDERRVIDRLSERVGADVRKETAESIIRRKNEPKTALSQALGKLRFVPGLQRALDQADIRWSATTVLINLLALGLFAGIGMFLLDMHIGACVGVTVFIILAPLLAIHIKRRMRLARMMHPLPDVFAMLSQGWRAGHSLANALRLVGQQLPDPAGTEFAVVFYEQNLGLKIEDALTDMADRLDLMDVRFFVTAVLIQRTTGGDLA